MEVFELHEQKLLVPIGYRRLTKEGNSYKIYVPKNLAEELLKQGQNKVFLYIEIPKKTIITKRGG